MSQERRNWFLAVVRKSSQDGAAKATAGSGQAKSKRAGWRQTASVTGRLAQNVQWGASGNKENRRN